MKMNCVRLRKKGERKEEKSSGILAPNANNVLKHKKPSPNPHSISLQRKKKESPNKKTGLKEVLGNSDKATTRPGFLQGKSKTRPPTRNPEHRPTKGAKKAQKKTAFRPREEGRQKPKRGQKQEIFREVCTVTTPGVCAVNEKRGKGRP